MFRFEIFALILGKRFGLVKFVVEFRVQMTRLETQHGAIGRHVDGESSVTVPEIFAIGGGRGDGGFAGGWNLLDDIRMFLPGAGSGRIAKDSAGAEFDFGDGADGFRHG